MRARRITALVLALGIAGAGAGCGRSGEEPAQRGVVSTAQRPSAATLRALHDQVQASLHNLQDKNVRYGSLPPYLAHRQGEAGRILTATPASPARTAEGDPVRVALPGGSAIVTSVGPLIPSRLTGTSAPSAPGRFTVTLTAIRGRVSLKANAFVLIGAGGGEPLRDVVITRHGDTAKIGFSATLPTGDGHVIFAPAARPLVTWDFTLETD